MTIRRVQMSRAGPADPELATVQQAAAEAVRQLSDGKWERISVPNVATSSGGFCSAEQTLLRVNPQLGNMVIYLGTPERAGAILFVKNVTASTNTISLVPAVPALIEGAGVVTFSGAFVSRTYIFDGKDYWLI